MAALHLSPIEKKTAEQKGKLVFEDEASFRQDSTLHRTWSRVGQQPLFHAHQKWLEVQPLPAYSPEFNAAEPLWHHTRVQGTHNRCFINRQEILDVLGRVFHDMQRHPECISGCLRPFQ